MNVEQLVKLFVDSGSSHPAPVDHFAGALYSFQTSYGIDFFFMTFDDLCRACAFKKLNVLAARRNWKPN